MNTGRHAIRTILAALVGVALVATLGACDGGQPSASANDGAAAVNKSLHARLPADIRKAGVVRVATDASYAPASFFARDGHSIVGFEPDLATALGGVLGVRFEFVQTPFPEVLGAVDSGEVDLAISAITDTAERGQLVDFVNYFAAGTSILVQRGNPHGVHELGDLCGREVAVEAGTVQVDLLERSQAGCGDAPVRISQYPTNSDALMELRTGRAAAVLNDYPPAAYLANGEKSQANFQLASDTQYEPGLYGIAVHKDGAEFRDVLRDALAELMASGEYQRVLEQWDVIEGALSEPSVNAGSV